MANPKSCSPTNFLGQSWSNWADAAFSEETNDTESTAEASGEDSSKRGNGKAESMKLHRTDFALFGICPTQDQFYLVVCEQCGQVVKPQGLKNHIDARHNGKAPNRPPEKMKVSRSVHPQPVPQSKHPPQRESPRTHNISKGSRPPPQPPPVATRGLSISSPPQIKESVAVPIVEPQISVPLPPQPNSVMIPSPVSRPIKNAKTSQLSEHTCSLLVGDKPPKVKKPEPTVSNHNQPLVVIPKIAPELLWTENSLLKEVPPSPVTPSTTSATTPVSTPVLTPASTKKSKKKDSPRKFLPLKDREYDPNKHCGVEVEGKPCLRSLTCKTHALSLRRKVPGRQKPLDELLAERKAINAVHYQQTHGTKHSPKQASGFHEVTPQMASTISNLHVTQTSSHAIDRLHSVPKTPPKMPSTPRPPRPPDLGVHPVKRSHPHSAPSTPTSADHKNLVRADSGGRVSGLSVDAQDDLGEIGSDSHICTYQQPKPIAVCHYGAHQIGRGVYLFDRRLHSLRSSLKALIDKQLNPPPAKKACASSSLSGRPTTSLSTSSIPSKSSANTSSMVLNQVATPTSKTTSKTISKSSHPKRSKTISKSIRAAAGSGTSTQTKVTKSQKKNATLSTSTSATATNANQLITNAAIPIGGTLQLTSGSSTTPFLVTTNGLQNAEYIDTNLLGVDSTMNLIDQSGNLKNLVVVTNIEPNVNGGQPNKVNQTRIPFFKAIAGNTPVLLQNMTVDNDGKMNVKSRIKNNSKLKGSRKGKPGLAIHGGVIVSPSLLQQQQQLVSQVKQDGTVQDLRGFQTAPSPVSKANSPQINQGSASPHMLSPIPNGIIPSTNVKPFLATSVSNPQQQQQPTTIVQQSPCNTSPLGPLVPETSSTTNFTAVLSQSGKVQFVATSKSNCSLGKPLTNQPSMQLAQQMTLGQASQLQSQQLMANLITTTQPGKPLHINNALIQNHATALPTVVQGKGSSGLTLAFNQQPIFLQGQNLTEHQQQ
ncbi:ataxin-7-like protein 1 [Anneissia japonica]|uniref:ataxin-7-like protein 1 n=1 Tax=Anneissia japonica TaxID=1529436 RepID=UPI00142598FC|nr:ataxin-7-like protein 1 [Anneissia japonica]